MRVIQTVAGGAGGSEPTVVTITQNISKVGSTFTWTARSFSASGQVTAPDASSTAPNKSVVSFYVGNNTIAQTYSAGTTGTYTPAHYASLSAGSNNRTRLEQMLVEAGLGNLPNGSYQIKLGGKVGYYDTVTSTGTYRAYPALMNISVSNGAVTITDHKSAVLLAAATSDAFRLYILAIAPISPRAAKQQADQTIYQ